MKYCVIGSLPQHANRALCLPNVPGHGISEEEFCTAPGDPSYNLADNCVMVEVDPEHFEAMVAEALDGLPADLADLMSNVAVTTVHNDGPTGLLGLYRGIP